MSEPILELQHITKRFPGVLALDDVSLDVRPGEVHALVGENGAGKSTLIKCCTGAVMPDSGKIVVGGTQYSSMNPQQADACGIAVIYQDLNSVKDLSAAENVFLGNEIRHGMVVDQKAMAKKRRRFLKSCGSKLIPMKLSKT